MSELDPTKLKVAELREELRSRGLDTKGVKAVLAKRLLEAINAEKGDDAEEADESIGELDTTNESDLSFQKEPEPQEASKVPDPEPIPQQEAVAEPVVEPEPAQPEPVVEPDPEPISQPEPVAEPETITESVKEDGGESAANDQQAAPIETEPEVTSEPQPESTETADENRQEEPMQQDSAETEEKVNQSGDQKTEEPSVDTDDKSQARKRKRSGSHERRRSRSGDRKRSRSRERDRRSSPPRKKIEMDDDSWETNTEFILDRYNCDLNLRIDDNGVKAQPLSVEGFAFMWAGARTMFGVRSGKVAFEVKLLENLNVEHLPEEEVDPHVLRVGWSADSTSLQLGEEPFSYGYGGTAKSSTNCEFKDYGEKFTQGDVVTAYLDFESDPVILSYSKNGQDLGNCYEVEKSTFEEKALFPHVLTKNTEFECNFGKREEAWFPLKEGYVFIEETESDNRIRGAVPPTKKEECEMIMMIGLPGAGKTTWANKYVEQNPDKKFNMLGTNSIIDKMKVMGLPRKRNYTGRWDVLIDMATKCLNRAIEIAARKKRNYILDQTNVYGSARRRKMLPFEGFQRKAVVIMPSDEDFKSRISQREKEEGKDIPEKAVLDMKANFTLPEEGQLFDKVEYIELNKEEADKLTETYRKEGLAANPEKRWRGSDRWSGGGGYRDNRRGGNYDKDRYNRNSGGGGGYRDYRSRGYDNRRSGGGYGNYGNYNNYGGYGSGGGGGGYRNDRYDRNRSNKYERNDSGNRSYSGSNWGKNQGWGNQQGSWGSNWNQGNWNQGYGNSGWGGYNQSGSSNYNSWGQGWNQNYWQGYNQGSGSSGSNNVTDYSQWYGQYSNHSGSNTGAGK